MKDITDMGKQAACFRFTTCRYDPESGEVTLSYEVDERVLKEKIIFPHASLPSDIHRQAAFYRALELLHLIAGVSYYKAGLARRIDTGDTSIDSELADFLNGLYQKGLAEFAYLNKLDMSDLVDFTCNINESIGVKHSEVNHRAGTGSQGLGLPERALVAMGGGKDSLVCLQMLKHAGIESQPVCVGSSGLIGETVKTAGLPLIRIGRELSTELTAMNAEGAWNGHVPVTAINSVILLCAGLLYGYRYIVFANESSANEATLTDGQGKEINHQYSKSFEFELAFRRVIGHRVSPGIEYFSLLRPFSEIAVTRQFSELTGFHRVFSSCNRNFHQDGSHLDGRWCQDCPKCRFTALALALFVDPQQLIAIQDADLLDQKTQLQGFKALCGLGEHKPFECVGSIAESRSAIKALTQKPQYQDKYIVSALAGFPEIIHSSELELEPDFEGPHCIPAAIMDKLN